MTQRDGDPSRVDPAGRRHRFLGYGILSTVPILAASGFLGSIVALLLVGSGSLPPWTLATGPRTTASPEPEPAILVGAGDIADCESDADRLTAELIAGTPGQVFTLGDNAPTGRARDYRVCYGETWGAALDRTHPVIGNEDYEAGDGSAYFAYFGSRAGAAGYYSFDVDTWHVIVLNSECERVGGCHPESPQGRWLAGDLAAHPSDCTLALWHRPLVSATDHDEDVTEVHSLWEALYRAGAELVINGHVHGYERFAPQTPSLEADEDFGIRQIIAGTGGNTLMQMGQPIQNLDAQGRAHGILELRLYPGRYEWEFVPIRGRTFRDSGADACHGPPPTAP